MDTKIVTIDLDVRSYDIYIGSGLLYRFNDFLPVDIKERSVFFLTDGNVEKYASDIKNILEDAGVRRAEMMILPTGEKTKSFKTVEKITQWLSSNGVDRNSILFAVGGGVVGDVTGFCASVIMRGVPYVHVPTTLLAQVDSSVGGKTGINIPQGKNLVGSFYQPMAVIADIETLKTLPERELLAGYAEVVKYALINDTGFFNWLERYGHDVIRIEPQAMVHVIETSTKAKASVVQSDERERGGLRALLNLGHTFGHALETAAGYDGRLLHGEAVAIGICMAFDLSSRMGLCPREDFTRVEDHFTKIGLPTRASFIQPALSTSVDKLIEIMSHDKKSSGGKMKFILVNGIGDAFISSDVPEDMLRDVIKDSLGGTGSSPVSLKSFGTKGIKGLWKSAFSSHS
jgi:3-dehydroquinate synthase